MKPENKASIYDVLELLQQRDPAWKHPKMLLKFKCLFDGWRQAELRAKIHAASFYTRAWKKGFMPKADFEHFKKYAMQ